MSEPNAGQARHIDEEIGILAGEGAQQQVSLNASPELASETQHWRALPEPVSDDATYYDSPVLKAPVWEWDIPAYYFLGGAAGAAFALGAAAQFHAPVLNGLVKRCLWIGAIGSSVGGALLVHDLGRPERFLAMLRVFRPTSPMNMGVWILSGAAPSGASAALFSGKEGWRGAYSKWASYVSGVFGLALATYTGVLVGNTAIPLWYRSRRVLPVLFGASGLASAASILDLLSTDGAASRVVFTCGTAGRLAEIASCLAMEHEVAKIPEVLRPLREGATGLLWRGAAILTAGSLVVSLMPGDKRAKRACAGALGVLGSLCLRFAVHYAGVRSARDPRATFHDQRSQPSPTRTDPVVRA